MNPITHPDTARRRRWSRRALFAATAGVLSAAAALLPSASRAADGDAFTLAIVPDTQQEVLDAKDTRLKNRFQWLVDHRKELNLKAVLQTGDLVNWDTPDHIQYERASEALTVLDRAGVPYSLAIGNHDTAATKVGGSAAPGNVHDNQRNTSTFNRYFPVTRQKSLQGFYEPGKVDNAYQTFAAGGLKWMVINVELWPRGGAVAWARRVADEHPDHNVIVITHSFLTGGGRPSFQRNGPPAPAAASAPVAAPQFNIEQRNGGYGDNSPQYLFDNFLSQCPNVRLVFSGHVGQHGYRTVDGAKGHTIHAFLTTYHSNEDNPIRLLTIDAGKGTMRTRVFAPSTGKDREDGSAFTVNDVRWVVPKGTEGAASAKR